MDKNTISPRPLPVFHEENVSYSTKKMSGKKREVRPPKLEIKRSRCVLFPSGVAKPICINNDANLSQLYDESLTETYFEQCFDNLQKLGEGSFGEVYKVRFKEDGLLYAVKKTKRALLKEVRRYELVPPHPHCIRLFKAWEQDDYLYMQMELCDDNLERYSSIHHEIPESQVWDILLDLVLGLENLHRNDLLHLDIKPANILLSSNGTCKLADFGLLFDLVNGKDNEAVEGDSKYMAPELMDGNFTKAADIYSLGITILEVSCDIELPTNGPLWHELRCGILPPQCSNVISGELLDLIRLMTSANPSARPSVEMLLRHKKLKAMLDKRKSALSLLKIVRCSMSDWLLQKIFNLTNGLCVSISRIYKKTFKNKNSQCPSMPKHPLVSPGKRIKRLSREPSSSGIKDIVRIQVRRPTSSSLSSPGQNTTDLDSVIGVTPPRVGKLSHSTPSSFSAKKLFVNVDSDDDAV